METLPALWTLLAPDWDVARKFADIHGPRLARYLEGAPYLVGADVGGSRGVAPLIQGVVSYIGGARARPYGRGIHEGFAPIAGIDQANLLGDSAPFPRSRGHQR